MNRQGLATEFAQSLRMLVSRKTRMVARCAGCQVSEAMAGPRTGFLRFPGHLAPDTWVFPSPLNPHLPGTRHLARDTLSSCAISPGNQFLHCRLVRWRPVLRRRGINEVNSGTLGLIFLCDFLPVGTDTAGWPIFDAVGGDSRTVAVQIRYCAS